MKSMVTTLRVSLFACCRGETQTKSNRKGEGFIWLTRPHPGPSLREARAGTEAETRRNAAAHLKACGALSLPS